jgi:DNA-dependent RNA polymerase auxiliary subunit epsilon
MLLSEEVEEIQNEFNFIDMVSDCGLDFEKQDF